VWEVVSLSSVTPGNRFDVGGRREGESVVVRATLKQDVPGVEDFLQVQAGQREKQRKTPI
jgi:hypothetical protein